MREHMGLYRGKKEDNGAWVEGNLIVDGYDCDAAIWETGTKLVTEVDPDTIGECTGLRDKNDKLIFEGDILRLDGDDLPHWLDIGQKCEVKYNTGGFEPLCDYDSDCGTSVIAGYCEIIGNIHDNPELMEG